MPSPVGTCGRTELNSLVEISKWRVREFLREPEAIFWVFAFPLILAMALGIAFKDRGIPVTRIAVQARGAADSVAATLNASPRLDASVMDSTEAAVALRTGRVSLVVIPTSPVTFRYDSTREESMVARIVTNDALQRAAGRSDPQPVREVHSAELGARYIDFLLPGLLGMNIMGTGFWGVGFGIVQARSRGLLKRFIASPMRRSHYLLGQMFARMVFLVLEVAALILFGVLAFKVPFQGSVATFALLVAAGGMTFAGMGLLVGSRARTLEGVSGLMNLAMMPMWILSGVFFSSANFPDAAQPFIRTLPLTALNDALRAVMLDGAGLGATLVELAILLAWMALSFGVALRIFRWQ